MARCMTLYTLLLMSFLSFFGCGKRPAYPTDTITTRGGEELTLHFYAHASLAIQRGETYIYIDPVMEHADYSRLPKGDHDSPCYRESAAWLPDSVRFRLPGISPAD